MNLVREKLNLVRKKLNLVREKLNLVREKLVKKGVLFLTESGHPDNLHKFLPSFWCLLKFLMCLKCSDRMTNNVDPDQTAPIEAV